jgi:soluble lytic murein transglycosylase-like protein
MKMLAVAAAMGIAMLVAGTESVRAEDGGETVIPTKKLFIEPWETRETGAMAATPEERRDIRRARYHALIQKYADEYGVPAELALAVVQIESNYRPTAKGRAGEIGLMQIKPATARLMGYEGQADGLYDPETNIRYGMKYLAGAHDLGEGKICRTILKYNAGHGARRMNPISQRYCSKVQAVMASSDGPARVATASISSVALIYGRTFPLVF